MTGCCRRGQVFFVATAGLGCIVVVLAGCSSSSSKTTTSTAAGSLSSSSSTAAASPSASPASAAQLAKIVLQPADFPAGWKPTPHKSDPAAAADDAEFHKCLGVPSSDADQVAEANSDDYDQGDAEISSAAYSFRSQSAVDADVAGLHSAKAAPCFEQELTKLFTSGGLPAGATLESVSFKITPGSAGGPANVAATGAGTFKLSGSGISITGYVNVAFITGPLIEADVTADNIGAPVPNSVMDPLVAAVAGRAATGPSPARSTAATTANGLIPYKGDRFTVSMPGTPDRVTRQVSTAIGQIQLIELTVAKGDDVNFAVVYADYPTGTPMNLDGAARGAASNAKGQLTDVKQVTFRNTPALDFRVVNAQEHTLFIRVLGTGDRLYQLIAVVPGNDVKTPPKEYPPMRDSLVF